MEKEFVNQTSFITDSQSALHVGIVPHSIKFLAMGTDGLTDVCLEQKNLTPHANFFKPFDDYLSNQPSPKESQQELESFLVSEKLNARTQDDKSLLIARWLHE
jgi:serine/threonine protein phosphatase PrpC